MGNHSKIRILRVSSYKLSLRENSVRMQTGSCRKTCEFPHFRKSLFQEFMGNHSKTRILRVSSHILNLKETPDILEYSKIQILL
ncbi:hypothetical protein DLM78_09100 [Leptospira stimsonii]|uniref:Uncharacterized protein n=1 Tax=Leptospira stimsonii TaxID=2202203 RepID=A0A8B6RYD8_9LEPT|nr:hypothetical protein DLM78_09100 [Leptospira stimsonii]